MIQEKVGTLLGAGDHDFLPHGKRFFGHGKKTLLGSDGHDSVSHGQKLLGSDDHDTVPHGMVGAGKPHGPRFADDDTLKMVKVQELLDSKVRNTEKRDSKSKCFY